MASIEGVTSANEQRIDALEQEQRRLARAVHDGPAQMLTNLALRAEIIERLIGVDTDLALQEVRAMHREALLAAEEIRQTIFDLVPPGLLQRDLTEVLLDHAERLQQRYGLIIEIDVASHLTVGTAAEVTVFRVVQEALQNVLRHSNSPQAWVRVSLDGPELLAEVWDHGVGFSGNDLALYDGRHLGIAGMHERAQLAGGAVQIDSRPAEGTRVVLRLPL